MCSRLAFTSCSPIDGETEVKTMLDVLMVTLTIVAFIAAAAFAAWLDWV